MPYLHRAPRLPAIATATQRMRVSLAEAGIVLPVRPLVRRTPGCGGAAHGVPAPEFEPPDPSELLNPSPMAQRASGGADGLADGVGPRDGSRHGPAAKTRRGSRLMPCAAPRFSCGQPADSGATRAVKPLPGGVAMVSRPVGGFSSTCALTCGFTPPWALQSSASPQLDGLQRTILAIWNLDSRPCPPRVGSWAA